MPQISHHVVPVVCRSPRSGLRNIGKVTLYGFPAYIDGASSDKVHTGWNIARLLQGASDKAFSEN